MLRHLDYNDFEALYDAPPERPTVVMFSTPSCSACRMLENHMSALREDFDISFFKMDAVQYKTLLREGYEVTTVPFTIMFLDKVIQTKTGFFNIEKTLIEEGAI